MQNDRKDGIQEQEVWSFRYSFVWENVRITHIDLRRDDIARLAKGYQGDHEPFMGKKHEKALL